ncbi:hypothetical protein [Polymorphobacter megasporae]|uniref:hypothetical protein n=1 Tax=Glacieibacterium megasporae TaxID=2835787 RepID=UPI001C1E6A05|nr:hypothetical protein [Polymorphobacter megasporae]UAJ10349.1 hypothetical protein KTC28_00830 [Polymorphobacter megasporae]
MIKLLSALSLMLAVPAVAQEAPPVAPVAPAAPAALTPAEVYKSQVVCKTEQETGSLVKKHKTCLTRKQWAYVNDQHESYARKMVDDNTSHPSGN